MVKWSNYFLNLLLATTLLLIGCNETINKEEAFTEESLLAIRKNYYQGSVYRQENSDQLINLNPNKAAYYQGKSMAHTKIGDYHIAFPLLEKAYSLDPKETGYYYGWLLLYYYRDYDRAIEKLNEYDNFTPNQADFAWGEHVNFLKGLCYKQMGETSKAIKEFDQVIELEGEFVDVYAFVYRGICKMQLHMLDEAIIDFKKAIESYPQNSMAFFYLGKCYEKNGQKNLAAESYQTALSLLQKGYLHREAYFEVFDAISIEMVEDHLALL